MPTYDTFISYRRKDTPRVQPLVDALRSKGVSVWFDQHEIDEFAPITNRIREGLTKSKALLVWYSSDYPRSRPCQMELTAAFIASQREGDPRKRLWVINPESSTDHIQPLVLRDEQHAVAPKGPEQYEKLAGLLAQRVATLTDFLGGIIPLTPPPQYGQRLISARNFVGRVPDFWQLHSALSGAETAIISGDLTSGVAQLSGMGGIGKSLLAEEYALRFGAAYPGGIFWLHALGNDASHPSLSPEQQSALRADQIRSFAIACGVAIRDLSTEEIQARFATKLGNDNRSFLWIVDDLASGLDANTIRAWLPPHPLGKGIFTTRSREYQEIGQSVNLGGLAPEEGVELLCSCRKPVNPEDKSAAEGIAADLGYHPLALAVCSRALEAEISLRSFHEFRAGLSDTGEDELELAAELKGVLPNGHEKSVAATLLRSVSNLEPEGQDLLRMAASLAAAPIPPSLLAATFAQVDGIAESAARHRTRLARSQVESASLAERAESNGVLVHTLVSRAMRFRDREKDRRVQLRAALVRVLSKALPDVVDVRTHKRLELEVFHARELCEDGINDSDTATLGLLVARYDLVRGSYATARGLQERVLEIYGHILGRDHPHTLAAMISLAEILRAQGDFIGARQLQERVLKVRRQVAGEEHPDTLTSMNNLAGTLRAQGDFIGARQLQECVLEVSRRVLGEEHPNTIASMNNLAVNLGSEGDFAGARHLQERVVKLIRRTLGEEHPDTLKSMNSLAGTLWNQGDFSGARQLEERVLKVRRQVLGEEHPDTLKSMNSLASTLCSQGNLTGARQLQERVLEVSRRVLGEEHPNTLTLMNNLAGTLRIQGDLAGARQLQERVLEISRRVLGEEHPDTLKSMNSLASTLFSEGDFAGARRLQELVLQVSQRVLGEEHPNTLTYMNNLASTLWNQRELSSARQLQEHVLQVFRRVAGEEHPDTLSSMNNLASTLFSEGDFAGALKLQERVLEVRALMLGANHSDTSSSEWNLLQTVLRAHEDQRVVVLIDKLSWLLKEDPATLSAIQRQIRQGLAKLLSRSPGR